MRRIPSVGRAGALGLVLCSIAPFATTARAQDVALIAVLKGQEFTQNNSVAPWLSDSDEPLFFNIFVATGGPGAITGASLLGPVGPAQPLDLDQDGVEFERSFEKQLNLDESFPAGDYQLTLQTVNDGIKVVTVTLGSGNYPSVPRVTNYDEAQAIDAASPFTLTWDPFVGGGGTDYIRVEVRERNEFGGGDNSVFESEFPGQPGALDGTDTSITIPADSLDPGKQYEAVLFFGRVSDVDFSYGMGVAAYALLVRETEFSIVTIGGTDTTSPSLLDSRPRDFNNDVPRNAVIAFEFDEPMNDLSDPSGSILWTGLGESDVDYAWSDDSRTLFCAPGAPLGGGVVVTWTLNPNGSPMELEDLAGNPLQSGIFGQFTTSESDPESGPDLLELIVIKGIALCQTDATGSRQAGAFFNVDAELLAPNTIVYADLLLPGGGWVSMTPDDGGRQLEVEADYPGLPELNSFFPDGTYTAFTEGVNDGIQSVELDLSGALYPPDPSVLNFTAAQAIDHTLPFTLVWTDFTNGVSDDPVFLEIRDDSGSTVARSPEFGSPGALNGSSPQQFEIPAHALYPGRTYEAEVTWARVADTNLTDYPGVLALAGYVKVLEFQIATAGSPLEPTLVLGELNNGTANLLLTGEPNRSYAIDASDDAVTWHSIGFDTAWSGSFLFRDYQAWNHSQRFYRAREISGDQAVIIYGRVVNNIGSGSVAGAIVSTSLDSQTAITDSSGYFVLVTRSESESYELVYEIRVDAEGFQPWVETDDWGRTPWREFWLDPEP